MKEKYTYNSQDIEDLLINKSFDELSEKEKEFALTQVDSESEYSEMRNTLITVMQIASEEAPVYVPNKIKEDLMSLMERKKKPLGWLGLGAIGSFLFPSNTPMFKKPGLQLATIGLMLLLMVNIGIDYVNQPKQELAINTTVKLDQVENNKVIVKEEEPEQKEEVAEVVPAITEVKTKNYEKELAANSVEVEEKVVYYDVSNKDAEEIADKNVVIVADAITDDAIITAEPNLTTVPQFNVKRNNSLDIAQVVELDEEIAVTKSTKIESYSVNANSSIGEVNSVSLNKVAITDVKKAKKIKTKLNSQNLGDNSEVIDLLFVAL